jgi:hypothetical protein
VPAFGVVAPFSWFVGAGLSGALYWATARRVERAGGDRVREKEGRWRKPPRKKPANRRREKGERWRTKR